MKILVIDDHVLIREALRGVLKELSHDAVLFDASSCSQAMQIVAEHADIGLILLDLNLPDRDGFDVLAELREQYPTISVVVLSALQDRSVVLKALDWGASGYIPKSAKREVMISALKLVFAGGIYIPPEIPAREELSAPAPAPVNNERPRVLPTDLGLTERQVDVGAHDAGQEQQSLSAARSISPSRCEESCNGYSQGAQSVQPHRSGDCGESTGLGISASIKPKMHWRLEPRRAPVSERRSVGALRPVHLAAARRLFQ